MKRIIFIAIIIPIFLVSGCKDIKSNNINNKDINIIYKIKDSEYLDWITIYDGDNYRYTVTNNYETYVEYKNEKHSYKEALEQNLITIDDLKKAGVRIYKEQKYKKNNNVYIFYREYEDEARNSVAYYPLYKKDETYSHQIGNYYARKYIEYNGERIEYGGALKQNLITINDLVLAGVKVYGTKTYQKNNNIKIEYTERVEIERSNNNPQMIYEDQQYHYYIYDYYILDYVWENGMGYSYKKALEQNLITIDDLIKAGVQIDKKMK